jgi:hypothetical protein
VRRVSRIVNHFGAAPVSQGQSLGSMFFDQVLLGGAEPAFYGRFYRLILKLFAAEFAVADLLDEVASVLLGPAT